MNHQEEIRSLLERHGVRESWLAEKLEIKKQTLDYLIYESNEFDNDLFNRIKDLIDTYQYEFTFIQKDEEENYDLFDEEKLQQGIGERIRVFAKRKYGTLKKLAEEMDISPQQLQQYISGKREPGSKILAKLLRLGCDINWVLGGSESFENYKIYKLESELRTLYKAVNQISNIVKKTNLPDNN